MEFTRQQEIEMGNELEILDIKILHQSWNLEKSEIEKINERRDEIRKYFTEQSKLEELQMQIKSNKFVEKWKKMSNKEKLEFYKEKLSKLSKKEKYEIKFTKQDIEKYEKIVQEESIVVEVEVESEKENEVFESTVEIEKENENLPEFYLDNLSQYEIPMEKFYTQKQIIQSEKEKEKEKEREKEKEKEKSKLDKKSFKAMKVWIEELGLMLQMNHPNLMKMYGICGEEQPPWLVLELMRGRSLNDELTDPVGLMEKIELFQDTFDKSYGGSIGKSEIEIEEMKKKWKEPLLKLRESVQHLTIPLDKQLFELFVLKHEEHWNFRTKQSHEEYIEITKKVYFFDI